jgi:hypothetical protein
MDDFIVVGHNKAHLAETRKRIEQFLLARLGLKTNSKTQIFPVGKHAGRALDFLGYRIYPTHRLLRKCSIKRIKYKLRRMREGLANGTITLMQCRPAIQSWMAHASHANTYRLRKSLFSEPMITGAKK